MWDAGRRAMVRALRARRATMTAPRATTMTTTMTTRDVWTRRGAATPVAAFATPFAAVTDARMVMATTRLVPWTMSARSVFIQTQTTPNPSSLMFQPGRDVYAEGSKNFASAREAMASPLAKRLFNIDGVTNVFFGLDFVTVTKSEEADWETVKPQTFEAIMNFYASGEAVMDESALESSGTAIDEDDDETVAMIKELLETRIRPAVAEDGGDIVFKSFNHESGLVKVQLQGSCDGCPSSSVTLKSGIENMLMHYVPQVKGVVQDGQDDEEMDLLDLADLHRGRGR
jgi:Fe-S cluster biogenesis protein NfuA